jgi:hypothetical protein
LLIFYQEREPTKANDAHIQELRRNHSAGAIAVSLSSKYGIDILWGLAPRRAMVAEAAAPPPPTTTTQYYPAALLLLAVVLMLYSAQ